MCGDDRALTTDGLIRGHRLALIEPWCAGSWTSPVEGSTWVPPSGRPLNATRLRGLRRAALDEASATEGVGS